MPIELGAEFIHGRPEVTWRLLHDAGLLAFDLPFAHMWGHRGRLTDIPDIDSQLGKVMRGLTHLGKADKSFAQYLREKHSHKSDREARQFATSFVEGFDAADTEKISAKSLAEEQQGIGDVEDETQFRLLHGYGSLIDYLYRSLDRKRVKVLLGSPISEVNWEKSSVEIRLARSRKTIRGRRALTTLPLGVLQIPPEHRQAVRFSPDITAWRNMAMQLVSGPVVKAILRFSESFWEKSDHMRDAAFLHDPSAMFPTWWTMRPLRAPVLTAWAGGPKAMAMAGYSKDDLLRAAIDSLTAMVKIRRPQLKGMIEQFHCYDWGSDPLARGAYSYVGVGGMAARSKLSKPIDDTLFFAGEALDTSGQASTVAGALASGQRAAKQLLSSL